MSAALVEPEPAVVWENPLHQRGWTQLPNAVLFNENLSAAAVRFYAALVHYAGQKAECWPGQERLAESLGVSERTIRALRGELEAEGLLRTRRRGRGLTNLYVLLIPSSDRQPASGLERQPASGPIEQQEPVNKKTLSPDKPASERNIVWDALVAVTGFTPTTKSEASDFGKTVSELRSVIPKEATAEQVTQAMAARRRAFERHFPGASFTHHVLRTKWGYLGTLAVGSGTAPGQVFALPEIAIPDRVLSQAEYREWLKTINGSPEQRLRVILDYQERFNIGDDGLPFEGF